MRVKSRGHRFLLLAIFGLFLQLSSVQAGAQGKVAPDTLVKDTTDKMLAALKKNHDELTKNKSLIYDLVGEIVLPHFDFIRMSRWVLGKDWDPASKDQKLRFIRAFRTLMVRTYAVALLDYTDQKIEFQPLRGEASQDDVTVYTKVIQPAGKPPTLINYRLYLKKDEWKVYDIAVDGISLVSNYRTSFASEIKQDGLEALITRLEKHNLKAEG
ncbi:MAG: ABC transporter substrate-binding protein [Gammaproteobacteria bacterium]|nr:ABC transporter substrate-binding protein [Gammaproteobacteria bacterium]